MTERNEKGVNDRGTAREETEQHVVVIGQDGTPLGTARIPSRHGEEHGESQNITDLVEQPAKVMRIGTMIKQLLEEVRAAPVDEPSRSRLREIHASSIRELEQGLAPELREELERLTLPFDENAVPSESELRIAQAQLVGWLEGVFHGIQTTLFAQQMAARVQLEQMRRGALPPGSLPPGSSGGELGDPGRPTGQYL
jgi:hypothetical protein